MSYERDEQLLAGYLLEKFNTKFLLEKYHIVNDFNEFVNYILNDINNYTDEYKYTGWNFSENKCICLFDKSIKYPIYLQVIDNVNYVNTMSITDRSLSPNKIQITINKAKLTKDKIDMQSILFHECRHCIEMYITSFNTIKDKLPNLNNDSYLNKKDKIFINRCKTIANLFADSEERARIDGTIHYLQDNSNNETYTVNDIEKLMQLSDNHSAITEMNEYLELIRIHIQIGIDDYMLPLYLIYLFTKYKCCKNFHIDIDISKIDEMTDAEKEQKCKQFYVMLEENLNTYLIRLYKTIFVHIIENESI